MRRDSPFGGQRRMPGTGGKKGAGGGKKGQGKKGKGKFPPSGAESPTLLAGVLQAQDAKKSVSLPKVEAKRINDD